MTLKAIFIYTDDLGRPVLRKIRKAGSHSNGSKHFTAQAARYRHGRLYWKSGKGVVEKYQPEWASKVIYNLPVVLDALRAGEDVWFTEGERDADTLMSVARVAATTTHQGIERITPEQAAWFVQRDSTINVLMDNDDPGRFGGWSRYVALTQAGVDRSRVRLWLPAKGLKDVTDAVAALGLGPALRRASRSRTRDVAFRYGTARAASYARDDDAS
jgi:hypothetical protein